MVLCSERERLVVQGASTDGGDNEEEKLPSFIVNLGVLIHRRLKKQKLLA